MQQSRHGLLVSWLVSLLIFLQAGLLAGCSGGSDLPPNIKPSFWITARSFLVNWGMWALITCRSTTSIISNGRWSRRRRRQEPSGAARQ